MYQAEWLQDKLSSPHSLLLTSNFLNKITTFSIIYVEFKQKYVSFKPQNKVVFYGYSIN